MAVYLTNSFEQGTSGVTVTTGNSGGGNDSAFNVVTIGASAGLIFSNAEAAHGSLSAKFTEPSTTTTCYVEWTTSLTGSSITQVWFRAYCYFTANPEASIRLVEALSSGSFCGGLAIASSTGKFSLLNAAGTAQTLTNGLTVSTNAIPLNAWFRLEGYIIGSATVGQVSLSMYDTMDSTTATETETTAATLNTTGGINGIRFGNPSDGTSWSFYLDDLGASDTAYLGPSQITGGTGTAALTVAASATGSSQRSGSPAGAVSLAASATGAKRVTASPAAALALAAAAAGFKRAVGAVTAALGLGATATGIVIEPATPATSSPTLTPAHEATATVAPAHTSTAAVGQKATSSASVTHG